MIDYILFSEREWDAFKAVCNHWDWVDYARYHDKYDTGHKTWWVYFKTPMLNNYFLYFAIEMGRYIERNKL